MNEQEIEHKIKRYETVRECAEERLNELNIQLRDLAEAEKPKLRHGNFGVNKDGNNRITLFRNGLGTEGENLGGRDDYCNMGTVSDSEITVFGNIFDLMEGWGEELTEFELDVNKYFIDERADMSHTPIHIAGNWHTEAEAYKFWCDFGQMLITLKRKETK